MREYPYRPSWLLIAGTGLFFAVCAVALWNEASTNDRGVVIEDAIELGVTGATRLYWGMCAASVGFVAMAIVLGVQRVTRQQFVRLGEAAVSLPLSAWSKEQVEIPYGNIQKLTLQRVNRQRFLHLHVAGGPRRTIVAGKLPSKAAFEEVLAFLSSKTRSDGGTG